MKILLFTPRFFGYDRSIERALKAEGHEVLRITYDEDWHRLQKRIYSKLFSRSFIKSEERRLNELLKDVVCSFRPELFFAVKGEMVYRDTLEEMRNHIPTLKTAIWQNDNLDEVRTEHIAEAVDQYDFFFSYDKGDLERAMEMGFRNTAYLPTGFDQDIFHPITPSTKDLDTYGCDVAFVGRSYAKREKYLKSVRDYQLSVYGAPYPPEIPVVKKYIPLEAVNRLYNCCKIGLSMHENPLWQGVNNRTFEICGSGCFCLVDTWNDIPEMFEVGKEIVVYDTPEEMNEQIQRYLANGHERRKIAEAGYRRAHAEHTFQARIRRMLAYLWV